MNKKIKELAKLYQENISLNPQIITCEGRNPARWGTFPCYKEATEVVDGKKYCKKHSIQPFPIYEDDE